MSTESTTTQNDIEAVVEKLKENPDDCVIRVHGSEYQWNHEAESWRTREVMAGVHSVHLENMDRHGIAYTILMDFTTFDGVLFERS